jgi:hypothetical protein
MDGLLQTVRVHFRGICTHFCGVVPGVAHRVVLPDAWNIGSGFIEIDGSPGRFPYLLLPHMPVVYTDCESYSIAEVIRRLVDQPDLTIPNLMFHGILFGAVQLRIANAIDTTICYSESYEKLHSLVTFAPEFSYSSEVVLGGRASAYVDFYGGNVSLECAEAVSGDPPSDQPCPDDPSSAAPPSDYRTVITVTTIGPPILAVTPMVAEDAARQTARPTDARERTMLFPLRTSDVFIGNLDVVPLSLGFDFLYHFLTMRGGIPRRLAAWPPGMSPNSPLAAGEALLDTMWQLSKLQTVLKNADVDGLRRHAMGGVVGFSVNPSCADSRYP